MIIESPVVEAGASAEVLFDTLRNPAALESVLPTDQVSEFKSTETGCSFKVTGGFAVVIERVTEKRPGLIQFASQKGTPIRFDLKVLIAPLSADRASVQVQCDADLNPFMKMMAEKPLQAIFRGMAEAVQLKYPV
mgnify:CR=1 FL=1